MKDFRDIRGEGGEGGEGGGGGAGEGRGGRAPDRNPVNFAVVHLPGLYLQVLQNNLAFAIDLYLPSSHQLSEAFIDNRTDSSREVE